MKNYTSLRRLPRRLAAPLVLTLALFVHCAAAQGVEWASNAANAALNANSHGYAVVVDGTGNTYFTGGSVDNATVGGLLVSAQPGTGGGFVAKRDPAGAVLWIRRCGATLRGLALDGAGQPVVAGTFSGSAAFGSTTLTALGGTDVAVARLDVAGNWLAATAAGSPANDLLTALAVQADGTAFVTGTFLQSMAFGSLPSLAVAAGSSTSSADVYVARLSPTNAWTWAQRLGNAGPDAANGLAVDGAGRVTVTGSFRDSLEVPGLPKLRTRGNRYYTHQDIYVAQLTAATGTWQWATRAGSASNNANVGYGLAADGAGTLSLTGTFSDTLNFGNDSLALPRLPSRGGNNVLVARLSAAGTWLWASAAGGTSGGGGTLYGDVGLQVAVDPAGSRTTVAGRYSGTATFGSLPPLVGSSGVANIFVGQVAGADGHWLNAVSLGTVAATQPGGLALDGAGRVYVAGDITRSVAFGADVRAVPNFTPPYYPSLPSSASTLAYAARLAPDLGTWDQVLTPDHSSNLEIRAVAHDAAGNAYVAGRFDGSPTFDTPAGLVRLTNAGVQSAFFGKLNPAGAWQWVRQSDATVSSREEGALGIAVDASGRMTVAGYFESGSFRLGSLSVTGRRGTAPTGITNVSGLPGNNVFVAQLDAATGAVRWLTGLQSTADVLAYDLSRDPLTDDLTLAGTFAGTVSTVGGGGPLTATVTGAYDALLARISPAGTWQWLRHAGGTGAGSNGARNNAIWGHIRQDASGNYVLSGLLSGQATFGSQTLTGTTGSSGLAYTPLVARLAADGSTWQWANQPGGGGSYSDNFGPVAADAAGNTYYADNSQTGNSGTLVRKYGPTGGLLWTATPTTPGGGGLSGMALVVDAAGDPTLLGEYYQTATFGSTTLSAGTSFSLFAAHLSSAGAWRWATSLGWERYSGSNLTPRIRSAEVVDAGGTILVGGFLTAVPLGPTGAVGIARAVVARLLPPPIITAFAPTTGSIGTVVILTGTGFTDASAVDFNGVNAPGFVVSNGGTTITVSAPLGVTTGLITVTSAGGTGSSPSNFIVPTAATAVAWTGAVDTRWELPGNWLPAVVPTAATDVTIPPVPNQPVVTTPAASANLTVQSGAVTTIATGGYLTVTGNLNTEAGNAPDGRFAMRDGTLELQGNLLTDGGFAATGGLVTLTGSTRQQLGRDVAFWNLTVGPAGALMDRNSIDVHRVLTLRGDLETQNFGLRLRSDATGTAMVVNAGGRVTNRASIERYIGGPNAGLGYRHLSSPLAAGTGNPFAFLTPPSGGPVVVNPLYNTQGNTARPFPTVFRFDESRQGAAGIPGAVGFDQGWVSPATATEALLPGRGYTVNQPASGSGTALGDLPLFVGAFNTGPVAVGALSRSGTGPFAGYHLLGNPYPSPIDWDNVAKPAGLDNAVYVFRSTSQYTGFYDSYVNGLGTLPGGEIAAMQGFFVRVSQPVPAFAFTDAARLTTYSDPTFRRGAAEARPVLALALRPVGGGVLAEADKAFIYFEAGATAALDGRFDAAKLPNPGGLEPGLAARH